MRQTSCVLLALIAAPLFAAEVYRSVDSSGNVVYSDRPEGQSTELIYIATPGTSSAPRAQADLPAVPTPGSPLASEELTGEVPRERGPDEIAAERARNCALSQERAERYRISRRLYRNLPNGEREYLSDAELDQARAKAEADVANWCG
jgi:hypothetical protein